MKIVNQERFKWLIDEDNNILGINTQEIFEDISFICNINNIEDIDLIYKNKISYKCDSMFNMNVPPNISGSPELDFDFIFNFKLRLIDDILFCFIEPCFKSFGFSKEKYNLEFCLDEFKRRRIDYELIRKENIYNIINNLPKLKLLM